MPIWSEILTELSSSRKPDGPIDYDGVRRKYLMELNQHSKRNTILYASGWLQKGEAPDSLISINDEDMQAFMEVSNGLHGGELDLILHSPGGSLEAAEAVVSYLRSRFKNIRVIVPQLAMSAATMLACAADSIVLGKHSFLGPIDPQLALSTSLGMRMVPAQAVLDQFKLARSECAADPANLSAWLSMLSQYGPDLLVQCESALEMSRELVETWLRTYMFKDKDKRLELAKEVSNWLARHENFKSHARHISRNEIEDHGITVIRLEHDSKLQDLALSVFHATTHTFSGTSAVKLVENHTGRAFIKQNYVQLNQPFQSGNVLEIRHAPT